MRQTYLQGIRARSKSDIADLNVPLVLEPSAMVATQSRKVVEHETFERENGLGMDPIHRYRRVQKVQQQVVESTGLGEVDTGTSRRGETNQMPG